MDPNRSSLHITNISDKSVFHMCGQDDLKDWSPVTHHQILILI